jgi:ATP-dependent 26S proteasome regulatory subunit
MNVSFLRGTWPSNNAFMREVAEFYNDYIDQEKKNNHARHFISKIVGRSKKQIDLGHGGGSEIASRPTSSNDIYDLHHYRTATPINASRADIGSSASYLKVDNLALDVHALKAVHDARIWYKSETWYREHNIAWKLGWLLHGKPGCGKSMLVRAIAEELDLPVFSYDLTSLANDELIPAWQEMMSHVPCIALVEDIDTVWEGRRNVAGDLTFDCFLNCLDGIQRSDGLFVIITTNYIEKIDPALGVYGLNGKSSRPGRIDRVVEMLPPDTDGRYKIARRILDFNDNFDIDAIVKDGEGETGAQFQDRCITEAIKYL